MISCECAECGSTYQVKDANAGRRFKCKYCDKVVMVPAARSSSRSSSSSSSGSRRRSSSAGSSQRSKPRPKPEYEEYDDYESYDEYDEYGSDSYDEYDDYDDYDAPPRRRSSGGSRSRSRSRSSSSRSRSRSRRASSDLSGIDMFADPKIFIGVPVLNIVILVILALLTKAVPGLAVVSGLYAFVVILAAIGLSTVGGILGLVRAFEEDSSCGLMYLFVPCYAFYYVVTRWEESRGPFMMQMTAVLIFVVPLVLFMLFAALFAGAVQFLPGF